MQPHCALSLGAPLAGRLRSEVSTDVALMEESGANVETAELRGVGEEVALGPPVVCPRGGGG